MSTELNIPEGIDVHIERDRLIVRKGNIELARKFPYQYISITASGNRIKIAENPAGRAQARILVHTFEAHIANMFRGVIEPYTYKLKICYVHFPITVKLEGSRFQVTNFLGEKKPRNTKLPAGADIKIEGDIITVKSPDIELAGMAASKIENITRVSNKDRRVFLDGIYITEKAGKPLRC